MVKVSTSWTTMTVEAVEDFYSVLKLNRSADAHEIRRNYQTLAKQYHPDKLPVSCTAEDRASASQQFQKICQAYETLSNEELRKSYDDSTKARSLTQDFPLSGTVDLDEMAFENATSSYSSPCRCGGDYVISEEEMTSGIDTVVCSMCTLAVRVLYQEAAKT